MYDHPFQWGSKRTGPDLARVGGKYSDEWHVAHLTDPRAVVPESIMPGYPFLAERELDYGDIAERHEGAAAIVGVPYTDEMIDNAKADLERQVDPECRGASRISSRATRRRRCGNSTATRACHGARCADRLSADAGHAGRLRHVRRRRSQSEVRTAMTYEQVASITQVGALVVFVAHVRRRAGLRLLARQQEALRASREAAAWRKIRIPTTRRTTRRHGQHEARQGAPSPRPPATSGTASRS